MIDLHTHTSESDGSLSPQELISFAIISQIEALAITDHDTLAGYDLAATCIQASEIELICGIEISTRFHGQTVHLLGYFLKGSPDDEFRNWISELQNSRRARNHDLVRKLQESGFEITMEEALAQGKNQLGRPHFAELMVAKGYFRSVQQAFDQCLGETGDCYVHREEPGFLDAVSRIRAAGGIPCLAHPVRISRDPVVVRRTVAEMSGLGLCGLEVYHSDHSPEQISLFKSLAEQFDLVVTGGSDFHGSPKPKIKIGTGISNNLCIPSSVLKNLRGSLVIR